MDNYSFILDFEVRDYECDIQGIVNNAVYLNYLEHARHEYLKQQGINFTLLAQKKINLVVVRAEIDYKYPLGSGDHFFVGLNFEMISRIRFGFFQDIIRSSDNKLILNAKITGTALNEKGRPKVVDEIKGLK